MANYRRSKASVGGEELRFADFFCVGMIEFFNIQCKFKHYPGDYELFGLHLLHSTRVRVTDMINVSVDVGFFRIFA